MKLTALKQLTADAEERSRSAAVRFAAAAYKEGLLDLAWGSVDSPFGPLLVVVGDRGLVRLAYPDDVEEELDKLGRRISPRMLESRSRTDAVRRELEGYFEGSRRRFRLRVDLSLSNGFARKVLEETAKIPYGSVRTYGQVAGAAGSPRAMRAAGNALASNPIPIVVPCHRVVASGGGLGGYTGGLDRKRFLLSLEGVM